MDLKIHLWEQGGLPISLVYRASPVPLANGFCCESWEPGSEARAPRLGCLALARGPQSRGLKGEDEAGDRG